MVRDDILRYAQNDKEGAMCYFPLLVCEMTSSIGLSWQLKRGLNVPLSLKA